MSWTELLFSFRRRINRKPWWIAAILVGLGTGALTGLLDFAARFSGSVALDPDTNRLEPTGLFGGAIVALSLASTWINFALSVKRLHDRDRSGWWLVVQFVAIVLAVVFIIIAVVVAKEQAPVWYAVAGVIATLAFILSVWLFVEIGFLCGTQGPNRFGPDPLGAAKSDAAL